MRKMIQLFSCVVCGCLLLMTELPAQNYLPIVKENAEWTVLKIKGRTQPDPNLSISYDSSYVRTWIEGDTVIAGTQFKKVFHREFSPGSNAPVYQGAIREADQMVTWIPAVGENVDRLDTLYNFNVEVGDTVAYYRDMSPYYFYVGKIDSITLSDNIKRKRISIYVDQVRTPEIEQRPVNTWIEGVGEIRFGLIYPFCSAFNPRCSDQFLCYKESENLVYESFPSACNLYEGKPNTFLPLPTKNVEWSVLVRIFDNYNDPIYTTTHYRPLGDTIIENKVFTKLYGSVGRTFDLASAQYIGAYINELSYVFFINKGSFIPRLMYNFNAPIGWISNRFNCNPNSNMCIVYELVSKDTVMYNDHVKRVRYNFKGGNRQGRFPYTDYYSWIEGLGSTTGFLPEPRGRTFNPFGPSVNKDLLCFRQNDTLIYTHPDLYKGKCFVDIVDDVKTIDDPSAINIYPNPAFEKLFIQHDLSLSQNTSSVLLMDVMGRVVLQKPLDAMIIQLDVTNLSPGIYFVQIRSKEGRINVSKKIIKSN